MNRLAILEIPEIAGLDSRGNLVRIPPELDVPFTDRVRKIVDTAAFRRLSRISQLGLVSLVYPAAHHTRFEHSLGVYRLALLLLKRLAYLPRFTEMISPEDAELLIVSALLHDIGHWPFCHPLEDIHLEGIPEHEIAAERFILDGEIAEILERDWKIDPQRILVLLNKSGQVKDDPVMRLLSSILSGPIDIDKMDYLFRDSLHAGVPYGRHFDQNRLIASLCLNESGDGLSISEKGKTAAEMMVFARYVMFNEVYWNHGVRAATSMLQRAFRILLEKIDKEELFRTSEQQMIRQFLRVSQGTPAESLIQGLFGEHRRLYKRVIQFSIMEDFELYRALAGKKYDWLCGLSEKMSTDLLPESECTNQVPLLIDAPPVHREMELKIDVYYPKEDRFRPLETVSPIVRTLAREQFDDYVKRVRFFAPEEIVQFLRKDDAIPRWMDRNLRIPG